MAFDFGNANDQQKEAIQTTEGPLLIIAGPGTGKTFTLVKRIVYLITERGIQPEEIMVATFTEKAAKELITRITNELYKMGVQVNLNEMYVGTFHSICLRVIKEHLEYTRVKKNYRMLDQFDQKYMIFQHINDFRAWNRGELQVALIHPASAGHGLNLQSGGNMLIWFGLTWSLELYQQTVARLWRQGQTSETVVVQHIITAGTIDEDVMKALASKDMTQNRLIAAVKAMVTHGR